MELKSIRKGNKEVVDYSERWWVWDSWDWHSPSYRFEYISRKGNKLSFHVYRKHMTSRIDALRTVSYSGDTIVDTGIYTIEAKDLERYKTYKDFMSSVDHNLKIKADDYYSQHYREYN